MSRFNMEKSNENNSDFHEVASKFDKIRAELEAKQEELRKLFALELNNIFQSFFKLVPKVQSVTWTQYTPYFMDGDECIFSMGNIFFSTDKNDDFDTYPEKDDGPDDWSFQASEIPKNYLDSTQLDACKKIDALLNANEDFLKDAIGDHQQVRVTRQGLVKEEYDHE